MAFAGSAVMSMIVDLLPGTIRCGRSVDAPVWLLGCFLVGSISSSCGRVELQLGKQGTPGATVRSEVSRPIDKEFPEGFLGKGLGAGLGKQGQSQVHRKMRFALSSQMTPQLEGLSLVQACFLILGLYQVLQPPKWISVLP